MGTGQTMITLMAMVLLSSLILTINRAFLTTNTTMSENRVDIMGLSLANSIIEDADSLAFDEKTVGHAVTSSSGFTAVASLGVDAGESASNPKGFDDFDDYNVYKTTAKVDTLTIPGTTIKTIFNTFIKVEYVDPNNPSLVSSSPTYHKRISLRVFSPKMNDTVKIAQIYSYWYFR